MSVTSHRRGIAAGTVAAALTVALSIVGVASAGASYDSGTKSELAAKKSKKKTVKVKMFRFPDRTKVKAGTKVVWKNRDEILHTVSSVTDPERDEIAAIDGDLDGKGAKYTLTFDEPGTYDYFCMIHPVMQGRIVVKG